MSRSRALWSKAAAPALGHRRSVTRWRTFLRTHVHGAGLSLMPAEACVFCMSGTWTTSGGVRCTACTRLTMMNEIDLVHESLPKVARGQGSLIKRPHGVAKWERVGACLEEQQT